MREIKVLFRQEFKTIIGFNTYIKHIGDNVDGWVKVLVFVRKQGRYYAIHRSAEESKIMIDKCKWVGQVYVISVIQQIPKHIRSEVIRLMEIAEKQEKHMQQIVQDTDNANPCTKARLNLTPETIILPGATEIRGFY